MPILEVNNLKKVYVQRLGGSHVQALSDVTFSVEEGEYAAIMGNRAPERRRCSIFWRPSTNPPAVKCCFRQKYQ